MTVYVSICLKGAKFQAIKVFDATNEEHTIPLFTFDLNSSTVQLHIQSWTFAIIRLLNKPYENEVNLTGQNPPSKCCLPFEILIYFTKGIDLSILKIWGLWVKGLQSYRPSNYENDSTPGALEPGPNALAHNLGGMAKAAYFFLRTPNLTASSFAAH